MFFDNTGLTSLLDNIQFEVTDADRDMLAAALAGAPGFSGGLMSVQAGEEDREAVELPLHGDWRSVLSWMRWRLTRRKRERTQTGAAAPAAGAAPALDQHQAQRLILQEAPDAIS